MYPRCCLSTPRTCFCLGHSVCINVTLIQHTQTVHARDALAVPQQIAAIQPGGEQEFLPRLPADFAVVHSHRVHGLEEFLGGPRRGMVEGRCLCGRRRCCCCCCCCVSRLRRVTAAFHPMYLMPNQICEVLQVFLNKPQ